MKKVTTLLLALTIGSFAACVSTQDCRVTGLAPGQTYAYMYNDSSGELISGQFTAREDSYLLTEVDSRIQCSDINVNKLYIAEYSDR